MIDLSKYRIIDLSHEVIPGELKTGGRYLHGEPHTGRPPSGSRVIAPLRDRLTGGWPPRV